METERAEAYYRLYSSIYLYTHMHKYIYICKFLCDTKQIYTYIYLFIYMDLIQERLWENFIEIPYEDERRKLDSPLGGFKDILCRVQKREVWITSAGGFHIHILDVSQCTYRSVEEFFFLMNFLFGWCISYVFFKFFFFPPRGGTWPAYKLQIILFFMDEFREVISSIWIS